MRQMFSFNQDSLAKIDVVLKKYPSERGKSAVMEILRIAQHQNENYLNNDCIEAVSKILGLPNTKVFEIATFYTMYNLKPVGKYHIQVCGTTPCMLRDSEDIILALKNELGIDLGGTSSDGLFTITEVECLGACSNAPVIQINDEYYYEDLNPDSVVQLVRDLKAGRTIKKGSQIGRNSAEPKECKNTCTKQ